VRLVRGGAAPPRGDRAGAGGRACGPRALGGPPCAALARDADEGPRGGRKQRAYPALSFDGQKAHAVSAFADESSFRIDLAGLALLEPGSPDFVDKLEAPRADVSLHFYEEEGAWYPALCRREGGLGNARLCTQFIEEFRRYMGPDAELL